MKRFKAKDGHCYFAVFKYNHPSGAQFHTQYRVWENSNKNWYDFITYSCFETEEEANKCRDIRQLMYDMGIGRKQ